MRRVLDWCLDNRPRFVLIVVVVVGLALAVPRPHQQRHLSLAPGSTTTSTLAAPATTTTVPAAPATTVLPVGSAPSTTVAARAVSAAPEPVQAACVRFLRAWASHRPQPGYSAVLRPLVVPGLYAGLVATDPGFVPAVRVGAVVSSAGDTTGGTVVVFTAGAGAVTCSVVASGAGYLVASFEES